jgi:hypothetical protein
MNRLTNRAAGLSRQAMVCAARLVTVLLALAWAQDLPAQPPDSSGAARADTLRSPDMPAPEDLPPQPPISETSAERLTLEVLLRREYSDRVMLSFIPDTTSSVTVESAWQSLTPRLERAGFHNVSVYPLESTGFAVVCPIEHIKDNGSRKKPEWGWTRSENKGAWNWLKSIVVPRTERYRMMMLIVPNAPVAADSALPDTAYAELLATGSLPVPPRSLASRAIAERQCELRVYEFYRKNENAPPEFMKSAATDARGHAERSRLWTKEELH